MNTWKGDAFIKAWFKGFGESTRQNYSSTFPLWLDLVEMTPKERIEKRSKDLKSENLQARGFFESKAVQYTNSLKEKGHRNKTVHCNLTPGIMLTLLLIGMLTLAFDIQPVMAEPRTWTVDDDGPADFHNIQEAIDSPDVKDGDTIFVSSGVYVEHLVVSKSLALVGEGRGATVVDGGDDGTVVCVRATSNVAVRGFTLQRSGCMCKGYSGVSVEDSHSINVTNNLIVDNGIGIKTESSYEIVVARNDIIENFMGISLRGSFGNVFHHNNFVDNYYQASVSGEPKWDGELNTWDDDYPSGGNYWSDYKEGCPNATEIGGSGIWDTPYVINSNNQDNYPLVSPTTPVTRAFTVEPPSHESVEVTVHSDSSISAFEFNSSRKELSFEITGSAGTAGFCDVIIPDDLLWGEFSVYKDGARLVKETDYTQTYNGTHYTFYVTYVHSTHEIEIIGTEAIPEFPSFLILPLFMIATLFAVLVYRRKHST